MEMKFFSNGVLDNTPEAAVPFLSVEMSFSQNASFLNVPCNWQDLYFPKECTDSSLLQKLILNA